MTNSMSDQEHEQKYKQESDIDHLQKGVITLDHPDNKWLTYVHQFQNLRFYTRPSSLQEPIQAHPDH